MVHFESQFLLVILLCTILPFSAKAQSRDLIGGVCYFTLLNGTKVDTIMVDWEEKQPRNLTVLSYLVIHEPSANVVIEETFVHGFEDFLVVENRDGNNETVTQYDVIQTKIIDLNTEQFRDNSAVRIANCQGTTPTESPRELKIIIQLKDINDPPKFNVPNLNYSLIENFPLSLDFSKLYGPEIYGWDTDQKSYPINTLNKNSKITFFVLDKKEQSDSLGVKLNEIDLTVSNYSIGLYLKKRLNFNLKPILNLSLVVRDEGIPSLNATIPITIFVEPIPVEEIFSPTFNRKKYSSEILIIEGKIGPNLPHRFEIIGENIIAAVVANDRKIIYEIDKDASEYSNCFSIDNDTATLNLINLKQLIESKLTDIPLLINAFVSGHYDQKSIALVNIRLVYSPYFSQNNYSVYVVRDVKEDVVVWVAFAGVFAKYRLKNDSNQFKIKEDTGELVTTISLRNAQSESLIVEAFLEDSTGSPNYFTETRVFVNLEVFYPEFTELKYSSEIFITNGSVDPTLYHILKISPKPIAAISVDGSKIYYKINRHLSEHSHSFNIDNSTAILTVNNIDLLIDSKLTTILIFITACKLGYDDRCSQVVVNVQLIYLPYFRQKSYSVQISQQIEENVVIWSASAGVFAKYKLKNDSSQFEIDTYSGELLTMISLKNAQNESLIVVAFLENSEGFEKYFTETRVVVTVSPQPQKLVYPEFNDTKYSTEIFIKNGTVDPFLFHTLKVTPNQIEATISDGSEVYYDLSSEFAEQSDCFRIDNNTADVSLTNIDCVINSKLTNIPVTIIACKTGQIDRCSKSVLNVRLVFLPHFHQNSYTVQISQQIEENTVVWSASAGGFSKYRLIDSSTQFKMNDDSGELMTKSALVIAQNETVIVRAFLADFGTEKHFTETKISVVVQSQPKDTYNPIFTEIKYSTEIIIENGLIRPNVPQVLKINPEIVATVADGNKVYYKINNETSEYSNCFHIDNLNAMLSVINIDKPINSKLANILLVINAFTLDQEHYNSIAMVNVQLIYLPHFHQNLYSVQISEEIKENVVVWTVYAGIFAKYKLKGNSSQFKIKDDTGEIITTSSLQNGQSEILTVEAFLEVSGIEKYFAETRIELVILNENKLQNASTVFQTHFECSIPENEIGSPCNWKDLTLTPHDNNTTYLIKSTGDITITIFDLNDTTGELTTKTALDFEDVSSHKIIIDMIHYGSNSEIITIRKIEIRVNVIDINEKPYFQEIDNIIGITPWTKSGYKIATFKAEDPDEYGPNSKLMYSLLPNIESRPENAFYVDKTTGELIFLLKPERSQYLLTLTARDDGKPKGLTAQLNLTIYSLEESHVFVLSVKLARNSDPKAESVMIIRNMQTTFNIEFGMVLWKPNINQHHSVRVYRSTDISNTTLTTDIIDYHLFAIRNETVIDNAEVLALLRSSEEELKASIGEFEISTPEVTFIRENGTSTSDQNKEKSRTATIIVLSIIVASLVFIIGVIVFKKILLKSSSMSSLNENILQKENPSVNSDREILVEDVSNENVVSNTDIEKSDVDRIAKPLVNEIEIEEGEDAIGYFKSIKSDENEVENSVILQNGFCTENDQKSIEDEESKTESSENCNVVTFDENLREIEAVASEDEGAHL